MRKIGLVFSKPKDFVDPLSLMGVKRPTYEDLAKRFKERDSRLVVVSTKGYKGKGEFSWYYRIEPGKVDFTDEAIKLDAAYDRSGGLIFPAEGDDFKVVDNLQFKRFSWNKWKAYQLLGEWMPETYWLGKKENLSKVLPKIKGDWVVLKPFDGLKGKGIYIGPKDKAESFEFLQGRDYLAQEFVDTTSGIVDLAPGVHDLRTVVINGKIVWSHVRTPPRGEYKSNVAGGGSLKEIEVKSIPKEVTNIVQKVVDIIYNRFDNPIFSVDFGVNEDGRPFIFELNDQMGFPRPEMKAKNLFISELVGNILSRI